jgi:hypothetical protein
LAGNWLGIVVPGPLSRDGGWRGHVRWLRMPVDGLEIRR